MKIQYILVLAFFCTAAAFQTSCKKEKAAPAECTDIISYQTQVRTMLDVNCSTSGCHDASGAGSITLLSHAQVSDKAEDLLKVIRHESGVVAMPLGGAKLADSIATQLSCWISQGKLDN